MTQGPPRKDVTNRQFGRLLALSLSHVRNYRSFWLCLCSCGRHCKVNITHLLSGRTQSCGCLQRERARDDKVPTKTHGLSRTRAYSTWVKMRHRCDNPNTSNYKNYGGRGITICQRWREFENFLADMGQPPPYHSIDRIDNNKGYEKNNCRWATAKEQRANQRARP